MYIVIDLETTSKKVYKRTANPFYNTILCSGFKTKDKLWVLDNDMPNLSCLSNYKSIIGHNLKFDLLYLWRNLDLQNYLLKGGKIWDTQLVEYILSGQQYKYPALRDIAVKTYGCKERIKHIEQGFEQGLDTSNIDIKLLLEDVKNDVIDTEQVALGQAKLTIKEGLNNLIKGQMDAVLATTEMEYNGMKIDIDLLQKNREVLQNEVVRVKQNILDVAKSIFKEFIGLFNSSSTNHISVLLFGGSLKFTVREQNGFFKTGQNKGNIKFKNSIKILQTEGLNIQPKPDWKSKKIGFYATNEKVLKSIKHPLTKLMLQQRGLEKEITTYYNTTEDLIYDFDGCVHGNLCHCGYERDDDSLGGATHTGRLSSKDINQQNQPRAPASKVKQHFISRFKDGKIIEFDYKMLEIVVFAFLTQDLVLIGDINTGKDIYKLTASSIYNIDVKDVAPNQRQIVKRTVLALVYGAGAWRVANDLEISIEEAQRIIDGFYGRYPSTKLWQRDLINTVTKNKGILKSITGRKYIFELGDAPTWLKEKGVYKTYKPQDIQNHPVQGLATADIVLNMIGIVWRKSLIHRDKYLLINTVHDSLVIDCKKEYVDFACNFIKNELQCVNEMMKNMFNIDFNVNIGIDIKLGNSWYDCA